MGFLHQDNCCPDSNISNVQASLIEEGLLLQDNYDWHQDTPIVRCFQVGMECSHQLENVKGWDILSWQIHQWVLGCQCQENHSHWDPNVLDFASKSMKRYQFDQTNIVCPRPGCHEDEAWVHDPFHCCIQFLAMCNNLHYSDRPSMWKACPRDQGGLVGSWGVLVSPSLCTLLLHSYLAGCFQWQILQHAIKVAVVHKKTRRKYCSSLISTYEISAMRWP